MTTAPPFVHAPLGRTEPTAYTAAPGQAARRVVPWSPAECTGTVSVDGDVNGAMAAYFERLTAPDAEAFAALFAETAEVRDPVGSPTLVGPAGMTKFHGRLHRAWRSLRMAPVESHVRGGEAAVRWEANGTSAGGNEISFGGINTFTVDENGKIARLDAYWDLEGVVARF